MASGGYGLNKLTHFKQQNATNSETKITLHLILDKIKADILTPCYIFLFGRDSGKNSLTNVVVSIVTTHPCTHTHTQYAYCGVCAHFSLTV